MGLETLYKVQGMETPLADYQLQNLNQMLVFVAQYNEFYQSKLSNIHLPLRSKEELSRLPFTTKKELVEDQKSFPPHGKNHSYPLQNYIRYHQTSGTSGRPLKVLDTQESWGWWETCWKEVYRSSGISNNDRIFLAFSFGPFIGFWGAFEAGKQIGALVITGGSQTSKERLTSILENEATVLLCTPSYALHLIEVAEAMGIDLKNTSVSKIITAGEPGGSVPSIRSQIESSWGASLYDHVGMTEIGAYGYSCSEQQGIHINDMQFISEIINPDTLAPAQEGEKGELVLTNLGRYGYPLIRYRTGDIVLNQPGLCKCGNPFTFLPGGIIGRADDMAVIRGINIYPSSIESIVREFPEVKEFRIVFYTLDNMDQVKLQVEVENESAIKTLIDRLRERVGLRIDVERVPYESLPRFSMKAKRVMDQRNKR
ncbi:phenylacetate--CoA ligase family protein [Domibacillus robiginosus]|uniref:phenylacetate--CoA ligase family protein n=1 Tax=Domibacillus robiginosus TaxID=1071054 RepID=UPI00067AB66A|nr:AMP-binding protein [Domibacillus robiginosus]